MQQLEHEALIDIRDGLAGILNIPDPITADEFEKTTETLSALHDIADGALASTAGAMVSAAASKPINLVKKLTEVMKGVRRIPKRAAVNKDDGVEYFASTAADVFDLVRDLMAEQGVLLIGRPRATVVEAKEVNMTFDFEFTDGEEGIHIPEVSVRVLEAREKSDKGIQTAYTIAYKLVMMNQFLISTGMPESEASEEPQQLVEPGIQIVAGKLQAITQEGAAADHYWKVVVSGTRLVCKDELLAKEIEGIKIGSDVAFRTFKKPSAKFPRLVGFHQEATHA